MPYNVKVPWENRLGVVGESEIKKRLSYFSTVNEYEIDIGLDFHCELLQFDTPLMPFYIQAKATEHFSQDWRANIKKSTIQYWLQQQFPVFLVVYSEETGKCYWMSIEDIRYDLLAKLFGTSADTISIEIDRSHTLKDGKGRNNEFIRKIKRDRVSTELFFGRPLFKGEGYVRLIPDPPRSPIELRRIKENVRGGLYSLLTHYLFVRGNLEKAYLLGEFLTKFDKRHYNHFVWFGQINKALGRKEPAKKSLEKALEICERDKKFPRESMQKIIARIRKDIESFQ